MKKIFIVIVAALGLQHAIAQVDRSKRPTPGPSPVISIKDPVIFNLPNGMTVLVVENHKFPKVSANLVIDAGPIKEGDKAGKVQLMGQMLGEGTKTMSKASFDEAVDMIGADVNLFAAGGSASALTRYFEKAFMLMSDGIKNPSFPKESLEKLKQQTITSLKSSERSAATIANRVSNALSYGKYTAMGEFPTEQSVKSITMEDIVSAYKDYITPSRSYLTFVGDITPAAAKALAVKYFGGWTGKKLTLPSIPQSKNPDKTEIDFVDLPTAVQAEISISNLVNNPMNGQDFHALLLANQILGGGDSKLFMNLREKHGFTYGSYSNVGSGRWQSLFKATAQVRTEKADSAVAEMVREILNMRDGNVTEQELKDAKAIYNGSFALGMEDPARSARFASNILINNLPRDFYRTYLQKMNKVTLQDIQRVSRNYFNENGSRIVIVGNGSKLLPNLVRLGYPIKKYDRYADPVVEKPLEVKTTESAKTTDKVSAYSIVEDYLKAIGGKEELKKINSLSMGITLEMMGRSFEGTDKRMNPSMQMTELKMNGMSVFKSAFDGTSGYQQQMGQKKDMSLEDIKKYQDDKGVIPQLYYTSADFKMEYLGSGQVNSESTYRLKVTMPSGKVSVQQYSTKTGLLLQEENTTKEDGQEVTEIINYSDYRKIGSYMFPHEITRNTNDQTVTMKITDIKVNEGVTAADFK